MCGTWHRIFISDWIISRGVSDHLQAKRSDAAIESIQSRIKRQVKFRRLFNSESLVLYLALQTLYTTTTDSIMSVV